VHIAWFEPTHHIVEAALPWFVKRPPGERWAILTPDRSVGGNGEEILYGRGVPRDRWPATEHDTEGWLACHELAFQAAPLH
jgi:hypothetical protein